MTPSARHRSLQPASVTGIQVRVPAERLYHVDGTPREAFVPPKLVEPSGAGEDAMLEAAVQWMEEHSQ